MLEEEKNPTDQEEDLKLEEEDESSDQEESKSVSEETGKEEGKTSEPETKENLIEWGGKGYTPEEFAKLAKEEFLPNYTRTTQELARFKEKEKETEEEDWEAKERKETTNRAFDLLKPRFTEHAKEVFQQLRQDERFKERLDYLEKTYDGLDGRPKFDKKKVLEYAVEKGMGGDPEDLYELMNKKELKDWEVKKILGQKKKPVFSEKTSGGAHLPKGKDFSKMTEEEYKRAGVELLEESEKE